MTDPQTLALAIQYQANQRRKRGQQARSLSDIRTVAAVEGGYLQVAPIGGGTPQRVRRLVHVEAEVGDEVLVERVTGRWIATGVLAPGGA